MIEELSVKGRVVLIVSCHNVSSSIRVDGQLPQRFMRIHIVRLAVPVRIYHPEFAALTLGGSYQREPAPFAVRSGVLEISMDRDGSGRGGFKIPPRSVW